MNKVVQFRLLFSREWVITRRGDGVLLVEWFADAIKERFSVRIVQIKTYECRGIIRLKSAEDRENIFNSLINLISDKYGIEHGSGVFDITIEDVGGGGNMHNDPGSEWTLLGDSGIKSLDRINNLVGADEFKKLAAECASVAPYLICNKILDSFASRAYLISINDGHGLSTYLGAFADLLSELELFGFSSYSKTAEVVLGQPEQGKSLFDDALLYYYQGSNKGRVLCVDISEWMTKLGDREFRDFLRETDEHIGENIIFFRVPFVEQNVLRDVEKGLRRILTVTAVAIPPFSNDELIRCAETILSERGYSVEDGAWEVFGSMIATEKSLGTFCGINTVRKTVREILYTKQLSDIENKTSGKIIRKSDIISLADTSRSLKGKVNFAGRRLL